MEDDEYDQYDHNPTSGNYWGDIDDQLLEVQQMAMNNTPTNHFMGADMFSFGVGSQSQQYLTKAKALASAGQLIEAEKVVRNVLKKDSSNIEANYLLGLWSYRRGSLEEAINYLQIPASSHMKARATLKKAQLIQQLEKEGSELCNRGKLAEALEKYTSALKVDPNNRPIYEKLHCKRADVYDELKLSDKVVDDPKHQEALDRATVYPEGMVNNHETPIKASNGSEEKLTKAKLTEEIMQLKKTIGRAEKIDRSHRRANLGYFQGDGTTERENADHVFVLVVDYDFKDTDHFRKGSEKDLKNLRKTFEGNRNCNFVSLPSPRKAFLLEVLAQKEHLLYLFSSEDIPSVFVIFILSHGVEDGEIWTDHKSEESMAYESFTTKEILESLNKLENFDKCLKLVNFGPCRGKLTDRIQDNQQNDNYLNRNSCRISFEQEMHNTVVFYSTVETTMANRNKKIGTRFAKSYCEVLDEMKSDRMLLTTLTLIKLRVQRLSQLDYSFNGQTPESKLSTVDRVFVFSRAASLENSTDGTGYTANIIDPTLDTTYYSWKSDISQENLRDRRAFILHGQMNELVEKMYKALSENLNFKTKYMALTGSLDEYHDNVSKLANNVGCILTCFFVHVVQTETEICVNLDGKLIAIADILHRFVGPKNKQWIGMPKIFLFIYQEGLEVDCVPSKEIKSIQMAATNHSGWLVLILKDNEKIEEIIEILASEDLRNGEGQRRCLQDHLTRLVISNSKKNNVYLNSTLQYLLDFPRETETSSDNIENRSDDSSSPSIRSRESVNSGSDYTQVTEREKMELLLNRAESCINQGKISEAETAIAKADQIQPDNQTTEKFRKDIFTVKQYIQKAELAFKHKEFGEVVKCMDECIKISKGSSQFRLAKAESLAYLGKFSDAKDLAEYVLLAEDSNPKASYVLGLCLYLQDDLEEALKEFQKVAQSHAKSNLLSEKVKLIQKLKEEGNELFNSNEIDKAIEKYTSALDVDPLNHMTNAKLFFERANMFAKLNLMQKVVDDCTSALKLNPMIQEALERRAVAYLELKIYDNALEDCKLLLAKLIQQLEMEGSELCNNGKFAEAVEKYTKALNVDPRNSSVMNANLYCKRADVYGKLNLKEKVIEDCTKAIKLNPSCKEAFNKRATACLEMGNYKKAVENFTALIIIDSSEENKEKLNYAKTMLNESIKKSFYKILDISKDATERDIKMAYRKKALVHHPDRHANSSEAEAKHHENMFIDVNFAYVVLSDPEKRSLYDSGRLTEEELIKPETTR